MTWKIFLVLGLLAFFGFCRRFETSIKFSQLKEHNGWVFIEKFRFAEGVGRFEYQLYVRGKAKSKSNHQLYIQGVPSEKWQNQTQKKCKNPTNMPVMIENMKMTGQKMSNRFQFSVSQEDTYYFVIKDCLNMFRKDYDNEDLTLHIKFHAFSNDVELKDAPEVVEQQEEDSNYEIIEEEAESEERKEVAEPEKTVETRQTKESSEGGVVAASTEQTPADKLEQVKNVQQSGPFLHEVIINDMKNQFTGIDFSTHKISPLYKLQISISMTWWLTVILLALTNLSSGRIFQTQFKFSLFGRNKGWVYLDKMTIAPGAATMEIQTYVTGLPYGRDSEIFVQAVREAQWDKQQQLQCKKPVRMPLTIHEMKLDGSKTHSRIMFSIDDYQTIYFVLKDCSNRFINDYNNTNLSLNVRLHILNNQKEIGEEEDHWYIVPFILGAGIFLVHLYMKEYRFQTEIDWPKALLFAGTVTQISSLCWKYFGYLIYVYTGSDHYFFHYIYLFLHSASESAVIALIVLVGFGWTLNFTAGQQFELFLPLVGALGIINIIITMITKIGHSHDVHHVFDTVGGTILMWFRVIIILIFIFGCFKTYKSVRHNLKKFMIQLSILGFIYIAATPIIVNLANYFITPRNRHEFVFIAVEITKFFSNLLFYYELNSKNSDYNRVNYKNASFLPEEESGFR